MHMPTDNYAGKHAYHGALAARYDEDRVSEPLWAQEQLSVGTWVALLPEGSTILDIPVGTGRFLPIYAERRFRVHGYDISVDMISEARRRYSGLSDRFDLAVGDAENLPQPDKSADFVICWRLAHLLPQPVLKSVLMEFRRVSRQEVLLQVLAMAPEVGARKPCWRALIRPLRQLGLRIFPRAPTPWSHITSYAHKESEVVSMAVELGFDVVGRIDLGVYHGQPSAAFRLKVV